jgi:4-diphosphocytidyl-2C-methyl-D-erythritol kinase
MKRVLYLVMVALVAMLILAPTAMAQETTAQQKVEQKVETTVEKDLPKSGGVGVGSTSMLLPAAALLLGAGVLSVVVLRRR